MRECKSGAHLPARRVAGTDRIGSTACPSRFRLNALIVALAALGAASHSSPPWSSAPGRASMPRTTASCGWPRSSSRRRSRACRARRDPGARLKVLLDGLKELRHVHIYRVDDPRRRCRRRALRRRRRRRGSPDLAVLPGVEVPVSSTDRTSARSSSLRALSTRRQRSGSRSSVSRVGGRAWPSPPYCS